MLLICEAIEGYGLSGLRAEAAKYPTFEEFERAFLGDIKHGTYWHITDDPHFAIDPRRGPRDMSSMSTSHEPSAGRLMITSHLDYWLDEYPDRKWVALIDMSRVPKTAYWQVKRGFGNEFWVEDPGQARVVRVMSRQAARALDRRIGRQMPNSSQELLAIWQQVHKPPK